MGDAAFYVASRAGFFGEPLVVALLSEVSLVLLASVALIITLRRPENAVGWLLAAAVLGLGVQQFAGNYGHYALTHPGTLPGGRLAAMVQSVGIVALVALALVFLVFPPATCPPAAGDRSHGRCWRSGGWSSRRWSSRRARC